MINEKKYLHGCCNICGSKADFVYESESLWRETLFCSVCKAPSRYRAIGAGVLRAFHDLCGIESSSLKGLGEKDCSKKIRIYDTQKGFSYSECAYPIPGLLAQSDKCVVSMSQYIEGLPLGAVLGENISNQNLEALTFADDSFDILITSDVMEHVRLDFLAHQEIYRVLKKNGVYIFTVPHSREIDKNLIRVEVVDPDDKSKDRFLLEPEYHGDVNGDGGGALSYRVYGLELDESLKSIGFDVEYFSFNSDINCIYKTELFYCTKK